MKRIVLFVILLASVMLVACGGTNLAPEASGFRYVRGAAGEIQAVPQLVVELDQNGSPAVMGINAEGVAKTLATFGIEDQDGVAVQFRLPVQAMAVINQEGVQHLQMVAREMAEGRFIFLFVNGEEMVRLNWAARGMLVSSLETTGAVPPDMLGTIESGLNALEATGDVNADFGVTTHLYAAAKAAGTEIPLAWPKTQAEIDAADEAAANAQAEAAAQAAADAGCFVTVASGDGPLTTAGRVAHREGLTAAQRRTLENELTTVHAKGTWFPGQTVAVSCPEETPGPSGSELGGTQQQASTPAAASEFVYILESGPLDGETPAQAAARLAPQGGFDRACLQAFFEAGHAQGLFAPGMPLPMPAACLADGN